jgi:phospholipase/carboxylesterase
MRGALIAVLAAAALAPASAACARPHAGVGGRTEPLPYVEVLAGGARADDALPLVVALHGRGDTAEAFATLFDRLAVPARVVVLRPPHPFGDGQAWFLGARAVPESRGKIAAELDALADRVVATADAVRAARPTRGKPIVMGFSQGAMLTWTIVVRHPDAFAAAFPVAGLLFPEALKHAHVDGARLPPVVAFHGTDDPLVPIADDRRGVALLEKRGARPELRVYPGVPHALTPEIVANLMSAMARALEQR